MALTKEQALAELQQREKIQSSLLEWAKFFGADKGWAPAQHHQYLLNKLQQVTDGTLISSSTGQPVRNLMILMPPGAAKALTLDTPIPTPTGWSTMGELQVGDSVFDEQGNVCKVTWKSQIWKNRPIYKVTTDCGDEIMADEKHEWRVRLCPKRPVYKIKETICLAKKRKHRPKIERAKALVLPDAKLPIDPYFLGLWLGDGPSSGVYLTAHTDDQTFYKPELARLGYEFGNRSQRYNFSVLNVRHLFVDLGLLNDPFHKTYGRKHIPLMYMRASYQQRLSLLQGLIDTDGTVCKKRGCTTFCNTNLELALQVRELVRSLGVKAGWSVSDAKVNGKLCGKAYKVSFYLKDSARLPRKRVLTRDQWRTPDTYVEAKFAGYADTVCIEVDSPSHLFLCGRSMTPTHNSSYTSITFPIWFLQRWPKVRQAQTNTTILACSYATDLIESFSRQCRNGVEHFSRYLEYGLQKDSRSVQEWTTTKGATYRCAGIGSGIAGRRADCGVIDDYLGTQEDADSKTIRDKQWSWYLGDFRPRLKPGAIQIIIANRRHEDDLVGRLLATEASKWEVISFPFFAEDNDVLGRARGQRLWPEWFTEEQAAEIRTLPPRIYSGLYQQRPSPEDGNYFLREWLLGYTEAEYEALMRFKPRIFAAADWAVSEEKDANRSCFGPVALDPDGFLYVLPDLFWKTSGPEETVSSFIAMLKRRNPLQTWSEKGHISKAWGPFLRQQMLEQHVYSYITEVTPSKAKDVRAQTIRGLMSMRRVKFPKFAKWWPEAEHELLTFPGGKADDFVDFIAHVGMGINNMIRPDRPINGEGANPKPLTLAWLKSNDRRIRDLETIIDR